MAACILTAASVWAWSQPKASATAAVGSRFAVGTAPSAAPTPMVVASTATVPGSTPSPTLAVTSSPTASPSARAPLAGIYAVGGWVRRIDVPLGIPDIGPLGPGGTIYVAGAAPLDQDGFSYEAYATPGMTAPQAFDADGTAYGVEYGQESASIWGQRENGELVFSYTIDIQAHVDLFVSKDSLIALYHVLSDGANVTEVTRLDLSGKALAHWHIPGWIRSVQGKPQIVIRPDGNVFAQVDRFEGCAIDLYTPDGGLLSQTEGCWQSLTQSDDGTLVGWSCLEIHVGGDCTKSSIAVLQDDGMAASGWPQTYDTATSLPAVGPEGIFFVASPGTTTNAEVVGLSRDGRSLKGWPVPIDRDVGTRTFDGCPCRVPPPVVVAEHSGAVMLQTDDDLTAWDKRGNLTAERPVDVVTGSPFGPVYVDTGEGPFVFAASASRVEALRPDATGGTAAFVDKGADKVAWLGWQRMPSGGIVVFVYHSTREEAYVVVAHLDVSP